MKCFQIKFYKNAPAVSTTHPMEQTEASRRIQLTWLEEAFLPESFVRFEYQHSELRGGHRELSLHLAEFIKCPWGAVAEKELGFGAISVPVGQLQLSQTARDCRERKVSAIILFVQKLFIPKKLALLLRRSSPRWSHLRICLRT